MKRIISILLVIVLLLSSIQYTKVEASGNEYPAKSSWYEASGLSEYFTEGLYSAELKQGTIANGPNGMPFPRHITKNGSKYFLNYRIFKQKNLYVYGNYNSVSGNYFKCGYQLHEDLTKLQPTLYYGNGYFLKPSDATCKGLSQNPETHGDNCKKHSNGTIRGEWKYFGFDIIGNKFSNMWMINVATETKFTQRNWQAEPWTDYIKAKTGLGKASDYNVSAYGNDKIPKSVSKGVRDWISATFNKMPNYRGIPTKNTVYPSGFSYDAYKFLYVQSPPTQFQAGSGRMWHLRENNVLWYQTFSIPKLGKKEYLPVNCTVDKTSLPTELPNNSGADSKEVILEFEVAGILRDDVDEETGTAPEGWTPYYKDSASRTVKYTRYDLESWEFELNIESLGIKNAKPQLDPVQHPDKTKNNCKTKISVKTTVSKLKGLPKDSKGKYILAVTATAKPTYQDKTKSGLGNGSNKFTLDQIPLPPVKETEPIVVDIPNLDIDNHIGEIAFDGVVFQDATDSTDMSCVTSSELYINGQPTDYDTFFSGKYTFAPTTDKNGYFAEVITKYNLDKTKIKISGLTEEQKATIMSEAPVQYVSTDYVYVYPTTPNAQFRLTSKSYKQNRIINIENTSESGNIKLVLDKYPIKEYKWSYGDGEKPQLGTDTDFAKQLQYKEPGAYTITLECQNALGKWSEPYTAQFQILEDYSPSIELNLTDSTLTRNDELTAWNYSVSSTDGDKVASANIELWHDTDNDGKVDKKLQEWNGLDNFPKFTPAELGYYKYKISATEEYVGVEGQDTLSTKGNAENKSSTYEVEFWVDNYQPVSDLYIDTQIERPNVDLFVMRDAALNQDSYKYLAENRVNMENSLLGRNILPSINLWDMKTYEYSTPASTSSNTGEIYPAETVKYSSGEYAGTLQRTSITDNGSNHDFGHTETKTESKTASAGGQSTSGTGTSSSSPPSSVSYSSDGYSGSLSGYGYSYTSYNDPVNNTFHWTRSYAGYSGTVSRTVSYWVPNVRWVPNYTGYYAGTIYKYVRQPYTNPWRNNSSKYILYVSDGNITELADFNSAASKSDSKIILAGKSTIKAQCSNHVKFIEVTGKTTEDVIAEALEYIGNETPSIEQICILQNQEFKLNTGEDDLEKDPIISKEFEYVHDKNYFDNSTGQEPSTQTSPNDTSWSTTVRTKFANIGKYQIYRRVKDLPSGAYGNDYSYYSGATEVDILVHRRPIALATLDWTYNPTTGNCDTIWVDNSFDYDHNITRAKTDKGIVERKIMFRKDGGEWLYYIPSSLSYGSYDVILYVKDIEGAWSDPWEYSFVLDNKPQFTALARSKEADFSLNSIPASEEIEAYSLWTRQQNPVRLEFDLTPNVKNLPTTKIVNYSKGITGIQNGTQDIDWYNQILQIPDVFPDGLRTFTVSARDTSTNLVTPKTFSVNVFTPINLQPNLGGQTINTNVQAQITARTTKYPATTTVQMQYGTAYQSSIMSMNSTTRDTKAYGQKAWAVNYTAPNTIPDGTYTARFISTNPSGKYEIKDVTYTLIRNRPPVVTITGVSPVFVYEGDDVTLNFRASDPDMDTLNCTMKLMQGSKVLWSGTKTVAPTGSTYPLVSVPTVNNIDVGDYSFEVTATDPYDMSDTDTYNFTVHPLGIKGYVNHTELWEQNRIKYNKSQPVGAQRKPTDYFPGEKFMLNASTTKIDADSSVTVANINCQIMNTSFKTPLSSNEKAYTWKGYLWDKSMLKWNSQLVRFLFKVTYSNGTVKTDIVEVNILDDEYWRLHRKF